MGIYYLGAFPPPYGGVTRKNELLLKKLGQQIAIAAVDFGNIKHRDFREFLRLIRALTDRNARYVVGVSGRKTRKRLCHLLARINPQALSRSILMLMGSLTADDIASDAAFRADVKRFRRVYAETNGMCAVLEDAGLKNTAVYPNPREPYRLKREGPSETLRCVYFSLISADKGADIVLEAAEKMPEIEFHFYGQLDESFAPAYYCSVERCANVYHHGIFNGTQRDVLSELSQYDILLLPTKCAEGVPGVLIEGKFAGLAEVVSPFRFSSDIVQHGQDGWILSGCESADLCDALHRLNSDRPLLHAMQLHSFASAEHFDIAKYMPMILEDLL